VMDLWNQDGKVLETFRLEEGPTSN
jgi:hypothetical protein